MNTNSVEKNSLLFYWSCLAASIFILLSSFSGFERHIDLRVIEHDKALYYGYLPALFIYDDITLANPRKPINNDEVRIYAQSSGYKDKKFIKMTCGVALANLPFFLLADIHCSITNEFKSGFTEPYHRWVGYGQLFYVFVGLFFLAAFLKKYFDLKVVGITILTLTLATNLYQYTVRDPGMAHGYLFAFSCIFIFYLDKFWQTFKTKHAAIIGFIFGWMFLIRPTMIIYAPLILLWGLKYSSLKDNYFFKKESIKHWLVLLATAFIPLIPQLIYWKLISGNFIYYSYTIESFFWGDPQFWNYLMSYKKGWLVYTPVMFFGIIGLTLLYKNNSFKKVLLPLTLVILLNVYINSCWWNWWFGGGFGCRTMIDVYMILGIGFANLYGFLQQRLKKIGLIIISLIVIPFTFVNIFQTYQYHCGFLHYDGMTKESYWYIFMKPPSKVDYSILQGTWKYSNCENALKGYRELHEVNGPDVKE